MILRMIVDTEVFHIKMVWVMPMLISIKEADYEYCYGIFLNKLTKATIYLKRAFIYIFLTQKYNEMINKQEDDE